MRIANIIWLLASLLLWAGMAWAEPHPVLGKFDVVKREELLKNTPPLYPVWEGSSRDWEGMRRAFARLSGRRMEDFRPPSIPVCDTSVADMDAVYQRLFPYPEIRSIPAKSGPLYPAPVGGLLERRAIGVRGVRVHMRWQPKTPFFPEIPLAEDTETWEEDRKFHRGNTAVTQDGSRTLVVTSSRSARQMLLFVYDEQGKLIRTRVLDGVYFIRPGLSRYYADNFFVLTFSTAESGIPRYSLLLDKEGDFLCWFADDPAKAQPTDPYLYGDQHAVCVHSDKWLIYRLPDSSRQRQ